MKKTLLIYSLAFLCLFLTACKPKFSPDLHESKSSDEAKSSENVEVDLNFDINGTLIPTDLGAGRDPKCAPIILLAKTVEVEQSPDKKEMKLKMVDGHTYYEDYLKAVMAGDLPFAERKEADEQGMSYYGYFLKSIKKLADVDAKANISYYEYIKELLTPPDSDPKEAKDKAKIDRDVKVCQFIKEFDASTNGDLSRALEVINLTYHETNLFASFYELLNYLNEKKIPFHLAFRSFGIDLDDIVEMLEKKLGKSFDKAFFLDNKLNLLAKDAKVLNKDYKTVETIAQKAPAGSIVKTLENADEIKNAMDSANFIAIRDHYNPWGNSSPFKEHWHFGKIFFPSTKNKDGKTILPLFFDDNAERNFSKNNIVRPVKSVEGKMKLWDNPDELVNKQIFKVDTLVAMMYKKYFIELVENALEQME